MKIHSLRGAILPMLLLFICQIPQNAFAQKDPKPAVDGNEKLQLIKICHRQSLFDDPAPLPEECKSADFGVRLKESCHVTIPVSVFLTNITDVVDDTSIPYPLPPGTPPIYLRHAYSPSTLIVTGPYPDAYFKGSLGTKNVFGINANLETYETTELGCEPGSTDVDAFLMELEVLTYGPDGQLMQYPIHEHSKGINAIFSCKVFEETYCDCPENQGGPICASQSAPPSPHYNLEICKMCGCHGDNGNDAPHNHDHDHIVETPKGSNSDIMITPNPAREAFEISFFTSKDGMAIYNIFDIQGRLIASEQEFTLQGKNTKSFQTTALNSGIYYVQINQNDQPLLQKVIIQK